jgi:hypothetical protein
VHFDLDGWKTDQLIAHWAELGLSRFPLDIIECPDRRIPRAALELAHELVSDHQTELTVLIPRREYTKAWHRLLHDRSSNPIAAAMGSVPNCNVTIVPYHLGMATPTTTQPSIGTDTHNASVPHPHGLPVDPSALPDDRTRVSTLATREVATVAGRVRSVRVQPWSGTPSLECTIVDDTGSLVVVFFGRRTIGGIRVGTVLSVTGAAGVHHGMTAMLNPAYTIISTPALPEAPGEHH